MREGKPAKASPGKATVHMRVGAFTFTWPSFVAADDHLNVWCDGGVAKHKMPEWLRVLVDDLKFNHQVAEQVMAELRKPSPDIDLLRRLTGVK